MQTAISTKRKIKPKKKRDTDLIRRALYEAKELKELVENTFEYQDGKLYRKSKRSIAGLPLKEAGYVAILANGKPYSKIGITEEGTNIYFSRASIVYLMHTGVYENRVEHLNGDTLDDRIENLAPMSRHIASGSIVAGKTNTGFKNIMQDAKGRFVVAFNARGIRHNIGKFNTLEEAKKGLLEGYAKLKSNYEKQLLLIKKKVQNSSSY